MRRIADLYPGEAVGFDQDLAAEATRTSNRIRSLLTQFHPGLERVLVWTAPRSPGSWNATAARPRCARPDAANSSNWSTPKARAWPPA